MTERVISTKVVGSADPISKKFRSIKSAVGGIGCGIVLLIVGIVLVFNSVNGVKEYSKIVEALPTKSSDQITSNEELVKLKGVVTSPTSVSYIYNKCTDATCTASLANTQTLSDLFYFDIQKQRYEIVKTVRQETRTTEFAGTEQEETVEITEYNEQWVTKSSDKAYGKFKIGSISIEGNANAKLMTSISSQTIPNIKIDNLTPLENYGQVPGPNIGSTQMVINSIPSFINKEVIIVGKVENGVIKSGDPFIITTSNEAKLLADLGQEESFQRIALLIFAWLSLFIGLGMLIAPILELVNWIPLFGKMAKFAAGVISFILATIIVLGAYVLIRFWYIFLILFIGVIVLAIYLVAKNNKSKTAATT